MAVDTVHTLIVGGGQAGIAMSEHLSRHGIGHLVLERDRIAERWRTARWDSLVANGPAWHDRFPNMGFDDLAPEVFAPKDRIVQYFEAYAKQINAPIRCGVEVIEVTALPKGAGFRAETSQGVIEAKNLVAATGPFQKPVIPAVVPDSAGVVQMHSTGYRNPSLLPDGAVMVVGAGASGSQIADELVRAERKVFLSVGPHDRPPIRYRGKDFCWWLGKLGMWDARTKEPGQEHITIAVSGAHGGHTVDFRNFAARGMVLLGRAGPFKDGKMLVAGDLQKNIAEGDAHYLSILDKADAYAAAHGLDLPEEPTARQIGPMPAIVTDPLREVDLQAEGITSIIWATGFDLDFHWLKVGKFDDRGRPEHTSGISPVPGLYYVGLPWLTRRSSAFIWGAWRDASDLADHIAARG